MNTLKRIMQLALYIFLCLPCLPSQARPYDINMMAPLYANSEREILQFDLQLSELKKITKDDNIGISVDVWWGIVEKTEHVFNWEYYDRIFAIIKKNGFKIIPIMSLHTCGGNINDNVNIPLPNWILPSSETFNPDILYLSENINLSPEYVSLWKDIKMKPYYERFFKEFKNHFLEYRDDIKEIIISCGPAGEIRYPSYNKHDGWKWPNPGYFQWNSTSAINSFKEWSKNNKETKGIEANTISTQQGFPPDDEDFIIKLKYKETPEGRRIVKWYNESLIDHAIFMLDIANKSFDGDFYNKPLGVKLPGIHWHIDATATNTPRLAEAAAGLINFEDTGTTGHGYSTIIERLATFNKNTRNIVLHFTCIEMNDNQDNQQHSKPRSLVQWIGDAAYNKLPLKGENALTDGIEYADFWKNIRDALENHHFQGVTFLRLSDVIANRSKLQKYFPENCKPLASSPSPN